MAEFEVIPLNNWARAFDEPIWVRITSDKDSTVTVYRDDENTPVAQLNVQKGTYDYQLGSAQDILNDHNMHTLIFKRDDGKEFKIPALWDNTTPIAYVDFYDQDTKQMTSASICEINPSKKLIRGCPGGLVNSSDIFVCDGCFIEVTRVFNDGTKYYYMSNTTVFQPAQRYQLYLKRDKKFTLTITYEIDYSDAFKIRVLGEVFKYVDEAASFLTQHMLDIWFNYPVAAAMWLSKRFGINLPILDVRINKETGKIIVEVDYEQDLAPVALAIIAAVVSAAVTGAIIYFIIRAETNSGAVVKIDYKDYAEQKRELAQFLFQKCIEMYPDDPIKQQKCLQNATQFEQQTFSDDTRIFEKAVNNLKNQNQQKEGTIKTLETMIVLIIVGALAISFLRMR